VTAQMPDRLFNDYPAVDLTGLKLYGVVIGDITKNHGRGKPYPFECRASPKRGKLMSALWSGYLSCYRITQVGQLQLEGFMYPPDRDRPREEVLETLKGDFWLLLSEKFGGPRTYVPFRGGMIVADPSQWVRESRPNISLERTRER